MNCLRSNSALAMRSFWLCSKYLSRCLCRSRKWARAAPVVYRPLVLLDHADERLKGSTAPTVEPVAVPGEDAADLDSAPTELSIRANMRPSGVLKLISPEVKVLLAADGVGTAQMVRRVGLSKPAVIGWKRRYAAEGSRGWRTGRKSGRPGIDDQVESCWRRWRRRRRPGGDALVESAAGQAAGGQRLHGVHDLEEVGPAAASGGDVQVLHRPRAGGQDPRRGRALPQPAGQGRGGLRG